MLKIKDDVDLKELERFGFKDLGSIFYKPKKGEWSVIEIKINKSNSCDYYNFKYE